MKPLAIDLFCGLGGWTEGLLAEGYYVVGFDIERHQYGDAKYPAQLVLQDILTIHGKQFKNAALIVASPPCQEFSYMAMPWSLAKGKARWYRDHVKDDDPEGPLAVTRQHELTALFDACFRIQREACEAAGHHIPMVVENVRGAIPWVGRSRWNFGSYHLWGDVPALMPMTKRLPFKGGDRNLARASGGHQWNTEFKVPGFRFDGSGGSFQTASVERQKPGHTLVSHAENQGTTCFVNDSQEGVKQHKSGRAWFADPDTISGGTSSKSSARKAASAAIAKIPFALARHIAAVYGPATMSIAR